MLTMAGMARSRQNHYTESRLKNEMKANTMFTSAGSEGAQPALILHTTGLVFISGGYKTEAICTEQLPHCVAGMKGRNTINTES